MNRKVIVAKGKRRFPNTEDREALQRVRQQRCLLAGRRTTITQWRGMGFPKERVTSEVVHVCGGKVEAHHPVTKARGGKDAWALPLCGDGHKELHRIGHKAFCERWNLALPVRASELAG